MERVYKAGAGPRLSTTWSNFRTRFPRPDSQIFARYSPEIPSEDCLFNYQRRDNSGSVEWGGLTICWRHWLDTNAIETSGELGYRPNREPLLPTKGISDLLHAVDYKANIFFRYFAVILQECGYNSVVIRRREVRSLSSTTFTTLFLIYSTRPSRRT